MENKKVAVERFLNLFKLKCPNCKVTMNSSFFDMQFDSLVFKCTKCKKDWI